MQLYWNRAELKKEVTRLENERHKLLEAQKKQEGIAARMRDHLDQLENYLGNPEVAQHALIYFQLRSLWRACALRIAELSNEVQHQQEAHERRVQLGVFEQERKRQLTDADRTVAAARTQAEMLEAQLTLLEARLNALRGFWNYFRRRSLSDEVGIERTKWDAAVTQVTDLSDDQAAIESAAPPPFPGLSIAGRRNVNTALIACAQYLVASLSHGGLAMLAKETTARRAFDVRYGNRDECARLMAQLREAVSVVSERGEPGELDERIDAIRDTATYRSDTDTIAATQSIATVPVWAKHVPGLDAQGRSAINVLIDDYWNLSRALLP